MAFKKEFIAHYLQYGKTDSWENLAKQFAFISGEALRSFVKRNRGTFKEAHINLKDHTSNFLFENVNSNYVQVVDPFAKKAKFTYTTNVGKPFLTEEQTDRKTGEQTLTFASERPLNPKEIDELAGVDNISREVIKTWLKSSRNGIWTYSIQTSLIKGVEKEENIDYKKDFEEFIRDKVKNENIDKFTGEHSIFDKTRNALILSLSDLHIDKLAYAEETGEDGNIEITSHRALEAAIDIIDRAAASHEIEIIYILGGNDYFHCNSALNTTQKGTPQDADKRWNTSFKKGLSLITEIIDYAKSYAPVDYITVYGNHSPEREYYLAIALEAYYRNDSEVEVETVNNIRKYFRYGNNAFMLSHEFGKKENDLAVIFALESPKDFSECKYKMAISGHFHARKDTMYVGTKEQYGLVHKVMPSLSATDKWHHENMYIGNTKACIGLVINSEFGEIAEIIYNA